MRRINRLLSPLLLVCLLLTQAAPAFAFTVPVAASFSTAVPADRQSVISLQGSDAEGTSLVYATTSTPSHGALSNLNTATGYVVYTPTAGYTGSDSFTYTVTSGGETSAAGTVTITVTNAKTTVTDTITDPSGAPRSGKVTFVLTQQVQTPAGLSPVGASVSAALTSSGTFTAQLYPSRSMNPAAYYQVYFYDSATLKQELLGVYDLPASTAVVSLSTTKVTDTNLAARYTFASAAGVAALTQAIAAQLVAAQIFPAVTSGNIPYWNGTAFVNSNVSQSGSTTTVTGNLTTTGTVTAGAVAGDGAGITGLTGASLGPNPSFTGDVSASGSLNAGVGLGVGGTQVVGPQGYNIPDPDGTLEGNTAAVKDLLTLFRSWGAIGSLYRSTLNDGLVSLWLMNNVYDAAGSNHLTNTGAVTFNSAGANFGGGNHLSVANNSSFQISHNQSFTYAARVRLNTKATTQTILSKTDGLSANELSLVYASAGDGIDRFRFNVYPGGTSQTGVNASSAGAPSTGVDYLVVGWYDAWAHQICISVDNGTADCAAVTLTAHPYTAQFAIGSLSVPGPSLRLNGSVRFVGLWSKALTAEERAELFENADALSYPLKDETTARLEHVVQPYSFHDNRAPTYISAEPGHFYALPYSRAVFTTAATSMTVKAYGTNPEAEPNGRYLNVRVNGADYSLITVPQAGGATSHVVALPVGQKTVEVWSGFQFLSGSNLLGTWLRGVTFNAPAKIKTPDNRRPHFVWVTDSIGAGAGATVPTREGFTMLLRAAYPGSMAVEGWGGRQLHHIAADAPTRAATVANLAAQSPDAVGITLGTNDYFAATWTAAAYGTAYGALLDAWHAASPTTVVYLVSPFPRTTETVNGVGSTLADYRTQGQSVCAARSTYCVFIDGTAVPGFSIGSDLYDVVHPNTAGHLDIANYFKTIFGL